MAMQLGNKDDNNINKIMLHKTVDQDQTLSISTKVPQSKAASFLTTSKRHMYRSKTQPDSKVVQSQICNMMALEPEFASCVTNDQAYFLQSGQSYMLITDFHYCLISDRSKPIFITRNCDPGSEFICASVRKPGAAICLQSVHKFTTNQYPCMLHINITKYNAAEINSTESRDIYLHYESNLKLVSFMSMENSKKGLLVSQIMPSANQATINADLERQYQFVYVSLLKPNKIKNNKHNSVAKENIFSMKFNVQDQEQSDRPASTSSQKNAKSHEKQYLYPAPESIHQKIKLPPHQHIIKIINSQFGDAIIVCTNKQIYELQVQQTGIKLKPLHALEKKYKFMNKNKNNGMQAQQQIKEDNDDIIDVGYVLDGLTLAFITKSGIFGFIEAENITYAQSIYEVLAQVNKKQEGRLKHLHMMSSKMVIQTDKAAVLVFKVSKSEIVSEKKIELPVSNNDTVSYKVNVLSRNDELVLQRVTKKVGLSLQICIKSLLSGGNEFITIHTSDLETKITTKSTPTPKIVSAKANTVSCILKDNSLYFYKLNPESSPSSSGSGMEGQSSAKPIELLFVKTLPQKPLYVSIDPYSSNVVILFREFVKFYKFCYHDIIQFYTYDVRNVNYAGYSEDGHTILIAFEDLLYFVNSFSYQTEYVMELYGDIKSVRLFDNIIYVLLKNKVNKHSTETLILQVYEWHNVEGFVKIYENKLQPTEALLTNRNQFTVCSQKQIVIYTILGEEYPDEPSSMSPNRKHRQENKQVSSTVTIMTNKRIKLKDANEYPRSVSMSDQFGVILIGTNYGRIYQYLWPFEPNDGDENAQDSYVLQCGTLDVVKMQFTANYQKFYVYFKNGQITQHDIIQYVECEQMPNIYIINPKTLHAPPVTSSIAEPHKLKYQFANREYLYSKYTPYIFEDIRQTNQNIEELRFIFEKTKDDIDEIVSKGNDKLKEDSEANVKARNSDVSAIRKQLQQETHKSQTEIEDLQQKLKQNSQNFKQTKKKQKQQYEKSLLELYKQATRLRNIYNQLEHDQTRERDVYLIENAKIMAQLKRQGEVVEEEFKQKFTVIDKNSEIFKLNEKVEAQKYVDQRQDSRQSKYNAVCKQLELEEQRKQSLLGSNGYLMKQISNYNKRKDEFEALIMQTHLQIEQLHSDRDAYGEKIQYLMTELNKKQKTIEEKQDELIKLVGRASMMKKVKESHQFQLKEYEKQFEPISSRMVVIDQQVKKMNGEILNEYLNKVQKDKSVIENNKKLQRLKLKKDQQIRKKIQTRTKIERFLAQLQLLLQDPMNEHLKDNLNLLSVGEKLIIDEEKVRLQIQSNKLLRCKLFIGKQISQQQKREQQIFRNKNQIIRHYNQNTMLVRQFNNLKQTGRKLEQMMKKAQTKYLAAKSMDVRIVQTPHQRTRSQIDKKFSQKKLTPFQKHEQQYNEMFKGGGTTETKLSRSGQSLSLLKSLIKDVEGTDSKYEKMEIVRDRIKSFVNPEIRIRKTLVTQRVLFERKKAESEYQV